MLSKVSERTLSGLHIAVTRPKEQAQTLCEAITKLGGEAIPYPLLAIAPLSDYQVFDAQIRKLENTDWAIFISSNAVTCAMPRVLNAYDGVPKNLRFAAIGHQTAKALYHYGVQEVLIPDSRFDSETLLALQEMQEIKSKMVAIFRGVGGRELLAETLKLRGAEVYFAESYRRINPQIDTKILDEKWQQGKLDAIIVTSSEAMRYLLDLAGDATWLKRITICVNHARIADLPKHRGLKVRITPAMGDEAMLQSLANIKSNHE